MNTSRVITILTVLILSTTAVSGAFGIKVEAAATEQAVNETNASAQDTAAAGAVAKKFSSYELGCMAQYYYKRTDPNKFCPPEVSVRENVDGTYAITLYENKTDEDKNPVTATYATYRIRVDGKGTDETSGKSIDLTLYSKVYTPQELCKLAQNYFYTVNDYYPPQATYTANKDGTYTVCLFESVTDEDGTAHNATCGWYTVNVCGLGTDDLMLQSIDING